MNTLRIVSPSSEILYTTTVETGSARNARRTTKTVAALFALGARVEVKTSRGWEARKIVRQGRTYYTRTVGC
jgi:hypothetical protein